MELSNFENIAHEKVLGAGRRAPIQMLPSPRAIHQLCDFQVRNSLISPSIISMSVVRVRLSKITETTFSQTWYMVRVEETVDVRYSL